MPTESPSRAQIAKWESKYLQEVDLTKIKKPVKTPLPELDTLPKPQAGQLQAQPTPNPYTPAQIAEWEADYLKDWQTRNANATKYKPQPLPELSNPIPPAPAGYSPAQQAAWESEYLKSRPSTPKPKSQPIPLPELTNPIPAPPENFSPAQQAAWESEYLKSKNLSSPASPAQYKPQPLPELSNPIPPAPAGYSPAQQAAWESEYLKGQTYKPKPIYDAKPLPELKPPAPPPSAPVPKDFTGWEKSQMQSDYLDDWERRRKPKPSAPPPKPTEAFPEPQLQPAKPKPNEPLPFDEPPPKPKPFEAQPQKPSAPAGPNVGATGAGALTAGQIARGGALITGLGIAQAAATGFGIGAGIADLINKIDPGGKEFLDDYFGKEVDKPVITDKPISAEIDIPVPPPQPIPAPSPVPVPSPIPPAPAPPSIPNAEWLLLEITYSGYQEWQQANYSYLNWTFRFDDNHYESGRSDLNYSWNLWVLSNRTNIEPRRYTIVTSGLTPYEPRLTWFSEQTVYYIFVAGIGDFVPGVNSPRNRQIFEKPEEYGIGGIFSSTDYARDWIYTPNPNPPPEQTRKSGDPYPYVGSGGQLQVSIKVLNNPVAPWTPPDTWNSSGPEEDDMACDLSPVINQLNSQSKQITTLQTTVNNLNINNTSTVNNINANTTAAVNTAVQTINSTTTTTVNGAVVAVNTNTATVVSSATNAINSTTTSVVNTATNTITSSISNLSSKLTSVADDILLNMKNGFSALEAALKPSLDKIDDVVSKLSEAFTKFTERFDKFLKWIHFDRVLNLLILITAIHNAAMLSNQLASSLTSMINSLLTAGGNALGLRGVDDEPIDIGPAISGAMENFVNGFIGKENNAELKKQWNKYNRIYQAAANLLGSIQSLNQSILSAMEIVGGNVARIGNALRKWGEVSEGAFNWMNPQPFFSNPFSRFVEKAQQGVEQTDSVAQETIGAQQQVAQIQKEIDDFKELLDKEEKTGIPAPVPAKTTATETEAKANSTTGATPLLPSEK